MKHLVIIGAGTGGTIVANRMRHCLPGDWSLTVVDPERMHLFQPGLLLVPFGRQDEGALLRPRQSTLRGDVPWLATGVTAIDPGQRTVSLENGVMLPYDLLVVATGARVRPERLPGLTEDGAWGHTAHTFYTLEGAVALRGALRRFDGGRIVVDVAEMPVKCPVAPLELTFLLDDHFTRLGRRDEVEIVLATPEDGCFSRPVAAKVLEGLLEKKGIRLETGFAAERVDAAGRTLHAKGGRSLDYDLLVSVPPHSGAEVIETSGLGDANGFVDVDKATLASPEHEGVFVLGDATSLASPKAGSVAHFQSEVVAENLLHAMRGESLWEGYDGHANCFVETGHQKGMLIDFNDAVDPLPGRYPIPGIGPFPLLTESRIAHLGRVGFRFLYWNALLPGRPLPLPVRLSMKGKHPPAHVVA